MSNIDDLLDATLDELEDLPEFKPFPAGVHRVLVSFALKEINKATTPELTLKGIETLELADPSAEPLKEGDSTSIIFKLDNEYGQGKFKKIAAPIAAVLGTTTNRETIEGCKDMECIIITSLRPDKNDKDKFYTNVKELNVV